MTSPPSPHPDPERPLGNPPAEPSPTRPGAYSASNAILTAPNAISFARVLLMPVCAWLLASGRFGLGFLLTALVGTTDWVDGWLARRTGTVSRVGQLLDPLADRLYIFATVLALVVRDGLPLWWALVLIGRDAVLACCLPVLRKHGYGPLPVHFLGKAATFNLLYAFPLLLLGDGDGTVATLAQVFGWAFAIWGTGLYWWAGLLYAWQVRILMTRTRPVSHDAITLDE